MKQLIIVFLVSIILSILLGTIAVKLLARLKAGQSVLKYVKEHEGKNGTPTMGGLFFVIASVLTIFFFSGVSDRRVVVICAVGLAYMIVGFIDDYIKIRLKRNEGLKPYQKIIFQLSIAIICSIFAYKEGINELIIPFANRSLNLGVWSIALNSLAFVATTNCVNLTDGLDGLAGGVSYVYLLSLATIAVIVSYQYNIAVCAVSVAGAIVGFLLFNTNRASVFMGDTGSLAIGGFISSTSIFSGNTLYIPFIGIIFVISGISVIIQVIHFKRTGNRIFLMAPYHHHLQMRGYSEAKIAFAYKLITLAMGLISIIFCL